MARSNLSQNHWAIKIGISRGHWSEIVNGKHVHPSPKTRERMLEVFKVSFEELFEIDSEAPGWSDPSFKSAVSDRYLVDEEIGQGGMGTVYLARDVKLGRPVAIKVLAPEAVSGIGVEQFLKEIRFTARLQHQNILGLHDAGEAAGHPYYVMPYVKGGSLRRLLEQRGWLSLDETLRIARGVANALHHAHEHRVLHCDVKPENILIADDHVYVADFGISRAIHAEVLEWGQRIGVDSSAGTPAYVSPEQASGERNLDARADVYSFGCMVFEMLAGRAPFTGRNTMEVVTQRFTSEVPDLRAFASHVPHAVAATIERAMALVPERRAATVFGFQTDLQTAAATASGLRGALRRAAFVADATIRRVSGRGAGRARKLLKVGIMERLWHDVRQAVRSLRRVPMFAATAILTLALGIGANTAIFTLVNAVLLRPLPYDRPEELAMIWELDREGQMGFGDPEWTVAPATYLAWQERTTTFADIAAFNIWFPTLSGEGQPESLLGSVVTPNLFDVLGVPPLLGSGFTPEHSVLGNHRVAMLSYGLWQRRFGGDPQIVGNAIRLNGASYTVVGVMPESYRHPEPSYLQQTQIWAPVAYEDPRSNYARHLRALGRLRPGVSLDQADADLAAIARQLEIELPEHNAGFGVVLRPVHEELFGDIRRPLLMLVGGAGFVLLIVCANVANLVLARSHGRRKEFAIRTALGSGRQRLARQLVAENVLLTLAGGILGLLAVKAGMGFLRAVQSQFISSVAEIQVDVIVVGFMMVLALTTGIVFGFLPVFQASRTDLRTPLLEESAGAGVTGPARKLRSGLVVAEVLLATVLVVGAGLLTRSFVSLVSVPTGFDADRLMTFRIVLPRWRYEDTEQILAFHDQLAPQLTAIPGVQAVSLVSDLPFTTINQYMWFNPLDDLRPVGEEPSIEYRTVGPEYFRTMGIAVRAGREFRPEDRGDGDVVIVVNEAAANRFWPNQDPIGKQAVVVPSTNTRGTVIGVVSDVLDDGFDGEHEPRFYWPFTQRPRRGMAVLLRTAVAPAALAATIRQQVQTLDGEVLVSDLRPMDDVVSATVADERMAITLAGLFSVLALALAGVGIYGVMSYAVGERRREIGVRSALGAQRSDVMRLILGQSGRLTLLGTLGGLAVALPLTRLLRSSLFGVEATDPLTLVVAPLVLASVAVVASYLPAARATKISPVEALRSER
jgi:putative ABC transport system permease protein